MFHSRKHDYLLFQVIYVTSHNLTYIDDRAFDGLKNVTVLLIEQSALLHPPSLRLLSRSLTTLHMSQNRNIEDIPNDYFFGCKHLRRVGIMYSQIRRVPNMNDIHTTLEYLSLFNNNITDIRQLYGVSFIKLKSLDLAHNKIIVVEAHLIILPVIYNIELVENHLIVVPDLTQIGWGEDLPDSTTVRITLGHGNPWHCSADMLWVVDFNCMANCASKQRQRIEISDVAEIICHTPAKMEGKSITDVGKFFFKSQKSDGNPKNSVDSQ